MIKTKRVIITGAPGTGKTTLLQLLQEKGYPCHPEVSRRIIKEQLALGTNLLPWDDLVNFSRLVNQGQIDQFKGVEEGICNFYDRGVPDVLAYLRKENIHVDELEKTAELYRYNPSVFILPPWPEIYGTDNERREDLAAMMEINNRLIEVYKDYGYHVIVLPKISPQERMEIVFSELKIK